LKDGSYHDKERSLVNSGKFSSQKGRNLFRKMAGFTFAIQHPALILGLAIVTAETVAEGPLSEIGPLRMVRRPRAVIGGNVTSRNDNRIAFDGSIVNNSGMTRRAALASPPDLKRLHMLVMTHDEAYLLDGRR
jgi:hypothetical protein